MEDWKESTKIYSIENEEIIRSKEAKKSKENELVSLGSRQITCNNEHFDQLEKELTFQRKLDDSRADPDYADGSSTSLTSSINDENITPDLSQQDTIEESQLIKQLEKKKNLQCIEKKQVKIIEK